MRFSIALLSIALTLINCSDEEKDKLAPVPDEPSKDATYTVGPTREFKSLQEIISQLKPGDIVDLEGNAEYAGGIIFSESGTADNPIVIRGKKVNGKLPIIREGADRVIVINGAYTTLEGLEIIGKSNETTKAGIGVYADGLIIKGCIIHDCRNGILGYGSETGSVSVEYCEIYNCGGESNSSFDFAHQIYMATDEVKFPHAVFRLQHCYIHNAKGGNNVKTRSGRNEIYYNWIEGARYHGVELIGPDLDDNNKMTENTKREDSDVVGNVIIATPNGSSVRLGGDGTGQTWGRYRFVNNTFIVNNNADALRGLDGIETIEMYNNIFFKGSATQPDLFSEADVVWVDGTRKVIGSNNYIQAGFNKIPSGLTNSITSGDPGFVNESQFNYALKPDSPLLKEGTFDPLTFSEAPFFQPLFPPQFSPPPRTFIEVGKATLRNSDQFISIGAF